MTLEIDDELLKQSNLTQEDLRIEVFARLFDQGRLSFGAAAELAGVSTERMERELQSRQIPRYRYTEDAFERDIETLNALKRKGFFEKRA